jgi:nitrate/nitrite transporter NarK
MFMTSLIIAGEAIYSLPYHVARFFRPTLLAVFDLTNTELGVVQATYGVVAMLAYFPGGPLADLFSARKLLTASLVSTAGGGLLLATIPGYVGTVVVFGFWGLTTILLFWAALIRATRNWGGSEQQGRAYGLLDGGRGLLAAAMASSAVLLFWAFFPEDPAAATDRERLAALRGVIVAYTAVISCAAVLVWFFVPEDDVRAGAVDRPRSNPLANIGRVIRLPAIWLQAIIVVCAYVGYRGFDNYSLFAVQGYGMDEVRAAELVTLGSWARPVAAVTAGLLADRLSAARITMGAFFLLLLADIYCVLAQPVPSAGWVLLGNAVLAGSAVFALRGVYFALFEEGGVPARVTGTAVGVISVIGFTPDIFVGLVGGWLLDRSPGVLGHQHFFLFLGVFAAVGLVCSALFERSHRVAAPTG